MESVENSTVSNLAEELSKMRGQLDSQNVEFRAEIDAVKNENKWLLVNNNVLVAKMAEMQAKLGELQARNDGLHVKLELSELKSGLANEQMVKALEAKMAELLTGQVAEQLMGKVANKIAELEIALTSKMEERNDHLQKQLHDQMDQRMTSLEEKMVALDSQVTDSRQNRKEEEEAEFALMNLTNSSETKAAALMRDKMLNFSWDSNRWEHIFVKNVRVHEDANGLIATSLSAFANVRARQSVSLEDLAFMPGLQLFSYYEVILRDSRPFSIGWDGPDVLLDQNSFGRRHPCSYNIDCAGDFWDSDFKKSGYADGFICGDIVGTGFAPGCKLFFTKNGRLNGQPIILDRPDLLYPAICFYNKDTTVEANFGADLAVNPFIFDLDAHAAQLFTDDD